MNDAEKAKRLIETNVHMTLATADADGKPWASTLFFAPDKDFNLYWVSAKAARHSSNVRARSQVGIVIFGQEPPTNSGGVYFDAEAVELESPADIDIAIAALHTRPQPDKFTIGSPAEVTGEASWRIYRAAPKEISLRADGVDTSSGQAITVRRPVLL
ncbi:MAG TPA: pyridoxamine 5'-phosphate oxidase family protein [Candidatus Saccharimonadia bacterium]|nr:pyridoxamine 5'-phosphate oxidase family protein [Candidatus Saccharimonadia bacterium]